MALDSARLKQSLLSIMTTQKPGSTAEAAQAWVQAYASYAQSASAGGFPLLSFGPASSGAIAPLLGAFSVPSGGLPVVVASALSSMMLTYWGGATFATVPGPGIAAPPLGSAAFIPAATALLLNTDNSAEAFASQLAALLDTCTRTVLVTVPAPTPYTVSLM